MTNFTHERISRKALCQQWTGDNTQPVMECLVKHGMTGQIYRVDSIMVRKHGYFVHTLYHGNWLVEGEDKVLRFYTDDQHKLMYQPILEERATATTDVLEPIAQSMLHKYDELERLRAFTREIMNFDGVLNVDQKMYAARKHGLKAAT